MTEQEWAQLISVIGFVGYGIAVGQAIVAYIVKNTNLNLRRSVVGGGSFVTLIAVVSAVSQLARPPFEWLSLSQTAQANAFIVWLFFFVVIVALWRKDA